MDQTMWPKVKSRPNDNAFWLKNKNGNVNKKKISYAWQLNKNSVLSKPKRHDDSWLHKKGGGKVLAKKKLGTGKATSTIYVTTDDMPVVQTKEGTLATVLSTMSPEGAKAAELVTLVVQTKEETLATLLSTVSSVGGTTRTIEQGPQLVKEDQTIQQRTSRQQQQQETNVACLAAVQQQRIADVQVKAQGTWGKSILIFAEIYHNINILFFLQNKY
mmetsp:Transcript_50359/g.51221  ORF Transcript_50359/g.51221 Transcript_50359/m.51221 type:complete len:216 (-) Transcript_50359:52-699(-)